MSILGIRAANLLLFVLSCFVLANIINRVGAFALVPESRPPARSVEAPAPSSRAWSERQLILDRNLFGARIVEDIVAAAPEPEEELQKTKLPLKLLGTVSSDDQVVASAAIENVQDRLHQVVRVGHSLKKFPDVIVARIDRGRVVLQNGSQREELLLDQTLTPEPAGQRARRPDRRASRRRTPPGRTPSVGKSLERLVDTAGQRSAGAIFRDARILPKYESGKMAGIELSQIKSDSFFQKIGLKNGDVVTSINGLVIDDPSAQKELLEAFTTAEELVAQVTDANGQTREIKADAAMLGAMMSGGQ